MEIEMDKFNWDNIKTAAPIPEDEFTKVISVYGDHPDKEQWINMDEAKPMIAGIKQRSAGVRFRWAVIKECSRAEREAGIKASNTNKFRFWLQIALAYVLGVGSVLLTKYL